MQVRFRSGPRFAALVGGLGGVACVHLPAGPIATQAAVAPVDVETLAPGAPGAEDGALAVWNVWVRAGWRLDPVGQPGMAWTAGRALEQSLALGGAPSATGRPVPSTAQVVVGPEMMVLTLSCPSSEAEPCGDALGRTLASPGWDRAVLSGVPEAARRAEAAALAPEPGRGRPWLEGVALEGRAGATSGIESLGRGAVPSVEALDAWWRTTAVRRSVWVGRSSAAASGDAALRSGLVALSTAQPPDRPAARAPRALAREGLWVQTAAGPTTVALGGVLDGNAGDPRVAVVEGLLAEDEAVLAGLHSGRHGAVVWHVEGLGADLDAAWTAAEHRLSAPQAAPVWTQPCGAFEAQAATVWSRLTGDADICRGRPMALDRDDAAAWWREATEAWTVVVVVGPEDPRGRPSAAGLPWRHVRP